LVRLRGEGLAHVLGDTALEVVEEVNRNQAIVDCQGPEGGAENLVRGKDVRPGIPKKQGPGGLFAHARDGQQFVFSEEPLEEIEVESVKRELEEARIQATDDSKTKLEA